MNSAPRPRSSSDPIAIFSLSELQEDSGACVLINDVQIAVFYLPKETPSLYALHNWDPLGNANVLYRGIVGDINGELVVAPPLYTQHFSLVTGRCLEEEATSVPTYEVSLEGDSVIVTLNPRRQAA